MLEKATVKKVWNDANNQDGKRPNELDGHAEQRYGSDAERRERWEATVENLPKYAAGEEIEYTWTERKLPEGYTLTSNTAKTARSPR